MADLPEIRSESAFDDFKPALSRNQAITEARRCLYCVDAPCMDACPTHIDVPEFIRRIATDNLHSAARVIFSSNILGMSCARVCPVQTLCVGACVYNQQGQAPIQIGRLQRFATDTAYEQGWRFFEAGPDTGRSVGIVGAGPAGLAAAHELRRLGHAVTIYEKRSRAGGLNAHAIAPYKMRADRALREADWVLDIGGVTLQTGVDVGTDLSWEDLEARHDALFLAFGLGPDQLLGGELTGVSGAVDFIERFKMGTVDVSGVQRAIVLGGGNTAVDAVRELVGLGVPHVDLVYRGGPEHMKGYAHEWAAARVEGVDAVWHAQPTGYQAEDGRVTGVRCVNTDANKQIIEGSEHTLPADLVLVAIGQARLGSLVAQLEGIALDGGKISVDDERATGRPGVFAGGDCINGGKEVVNAAADGKAAATAIHRYLSPKGA